MRRFISAAYRRLILVALTAGAALTAASIVLPSSSEAAPGPNCTFYSDASHTTVVGRYGKDCCNNTIAWGQKTPYAECGDACLLCTPPPLD